MKVEFNIKIPRRSAVENRKRAELIANKLAISLILEEFSVDCVTIGDHHFSLAEIRKVNSRITGGLV